MPFLGVIGKLNMGDVKVPVVLKSAFFVLRGAAWLTLALAFVPPALEALPTDCRACRWMNDFEGARPNGSLAPLL